MKEIAARSDLVLVVGSRNSSNSVRMVEVALLEGTAAYLVPDVTELDVSWLEGVRTIGVSAGASAPELLVDQLLERLDELGYHDVELSVTTKEDIVFQLPSGLAQGRPSA